MTTLSICPDSVVLTEHSSSVETTSDPAEIVAALATIGVGFERWEAEQPIASDASNEDILAAYAGPIARLKERFGFQSMDVARIYPEHPARTEARGKFRAEHTHDDFEVRFFVEGQGRFYLHKDGKVFMVTATRGDLLSVPGGTPHWFDMGERPHFTAIRLFTTPDGWVAKFTGSPIAADFPALDT